MNGLKNEYIEVTKIKHKRNKLLFAASLIGVSLSVMISLSFLFSSVLNVSIWLPFSFYSVKFSEKTFYAVSLDEFLTEEEATTYARISKLKGAAGVIVNGSTAYKVIAAVYSDIDSASNVKDGLVASSYAAEVVTLSAPQVNIKDLNSLERTDLKNIYSSLLNNYKDLYELSIAFDTGKKNNAEVASEIARKLTDLQKLKSGLHGSKNATLVLARNHLDKVIDLFLCLTTTQVIEGETIPYTAEIKCAYVKIVYYYVEFCEK